MRKRENVTLLASQKKLFLSVQKKRFHTAVIIIIGIPRRSAATTTATPSHINGVEGLCGEWEEGKRDE